jgi:hypothetical protein
VAGRPLSNSARETEARTPPIAVFVDVFVGNIDANFREVKAIRL